MLATSLLAFGGRYSRGTLGVRNVKEYSVLILSALDCCKYAHASDKGESNNMATQKFVIEIEYLAGDQGYAEAELQELLSTHLQDYDTKVHSVKLERSKAVNNAV